MSRRTATWLACSLWVVCVALIALALLLDFLTADVPLQPGERLLRLGPGLAVLTGVLSLAYPTVGALIASRLPTNPIGWIFCGVGLLYGVRRFTGAYADYALFENIALPGGEHAAWLSTWTGPAGLTLAGVFPYAAVPRRAATVSSLADRGMGGALGSHGARTCGRIQARVFVHLPLG